MSTTMQQGTKIGFIGLGAMGSGMAASLCRTRFAVTGYDLRREATDRLAQLGGAGAGSPEEVARGAPLAFGVALGADPKVLYEVIRCAAGGSWRFNDRVPHMLAQDDTPRSACDIWVKDLGMMLGIGKDRRMPLPMAVAADQVVMTADAQGLGPIDDAGLVKVYEGFTGKRIAGAKNEGEEHP
jgi:3-hydroxyisobutyrate dehydrogenase-like beta-hydroxyacid dehydrogenase